MHHAEEEERRERTPSGMPGAIALPEMEGEQRNEGTEKTLEKYRNVREKSTVMGTIAACSEAVSSKSGEPPPHASSFAIQNGSQPQPLRELQLAAI